MQYVLSAAQMQALDKRCIDEFGIPSGILMENAGKACADHLQREYFKDACLSIAILCGKGNNGGDGYVIARWLHHYGHKVYIIVADKGNSSAETIANALLCKRLDIPFIDFQEAGDNSLKNLKADAYIDAIFGIGFKWEPNESVGKLIETVNSLSGLKVAIDIPSGLNADNGQAKLCIKADLTLVIEALKYGHLLGSGKQLCGKLYIVSIGIPKAYYKELKAAQMIDSPILPSRTVSAHKGTNGRVLIFAGSIEYSGAALLCAKAALHSGAGYIHLFCRKELHEHFIGNMPEVLLVPLPIIGDGGAKRFQIIADDLEKADAIVVGPGLGNDFYSKDLLTYLLQNCQCPMILDADAINVLSSHEHLWELTEGKDIVLTPHVGEFLRLSGCDKEAFFADPIGTLRAFVDKRKVAILLKSHYSIYMDSSSCIIHNSGNDGLGTGGSGDVLSGIIGSFCAQGLPISCSAISASYLMGITAERLSEKIATFGITPSLIIDHLFIKE